MNNLSVALVQTDIVWENIDENLEFYTKKILSIKNDVDLIVLPEMFTTGFSMKPESLAETMSDKGVNWMQEMSEKANANICGSLIIEEYGKYINRFLNCSPDGNISYYDKRHLFRMGNEHEHYIAGNKRLIYKIGDWRIHALVCYDLRFPVWSRNKNEYDVLIYVANWPESRREVWKKLLMARAIENQCFVIGVNRIGKDGTGITYSGDSMLIDPRGNVTVKAKDYNEEIIYSELSLSELIDFRNKFPVMLDADDFEIK
jgi:omega-amidase